MTNIFFNRKKCLTAFLFAFIFLISLSGSASAVCTNVCTVGDKDTPGVDYTVTHSYDENVINAALKAVAPHNGTVILKKTSIPYKIFNEITMQNYTNIRGETSDTTIQAMQKTYYSGIDRRLINTVASGTHIGVYNLNFIGSGYLGGWPGGANDEYIIGSGSASYFTIENVTGTQGADDFIGGGFYDSIIKNVHYTKAGHTGLMIGNGRNLTIDGVYCDDLGNTCVRMDGMIGGTIKNVFSTDSVGGPSTQFAIQLDGTSYSPIRDISIENITAISQTLSGILLFDNAPAASGYYIKNIIMKNILVDCYGYNTGASCSGGTITGASYQAGIAILNVDNVTIDGATVVNARQGAGYSGIRIWNGETNDPINIHIKNTIVTDSSGYGIIVTPGSKTVNMDVTYSNLWANTLGNTYGFTPGIGMTYVNPFFNRSQATWGVYTTQADYRLRSQYGRWDDKAQNWVNDAVTSPAIGKGDPTSDNSKSPWGGIIEMGAFGNTPYASSGGDPTKVSKPTFNPDGGRYSSAKTVEITAWPNDADIYYTTNGDEPVNYTPSSSTKYAAPVNIASNTTLKAKGWKTNLNASDTASAYYEIYTPEARSITISPSSASVSEGSTQQFTANVLDQYNTPMPSAAVAWTSSNTTVGTIISGSFTAGLPGTTTITASSGGYSANASVTVVKSLVGQWNFDDASGTKASDSSGNNNEGAIYGAIWAQGKIDGALSFNGASNYIDVTKSNSLDTITNQITISAWVKTPFTNRDTVVERWYIPTNDRAYVLTVEPSGSIEFSLSSDGTTTSGKMKYLDSIGKIPSNTWTHIAATSDGTTMKIYINGTQDTATTASPAGGIKIPNTNLRIGAWAASSSARDTYFNGSIDEVKLYNKALTAQEIKTEYDRDMGVPDTTPPSVTIAYPSSGQTFSTSNIAVNGTASDNAALSKVEVKVNSGVWQLATGTSSWSSSVALASGSNTIYANATDASGNSGVASVSVIYDAQPPALYISAKTLFDAYKLGEYVGLA